MKESLSHHLFQEDLYDFAYPVVVVLQRSWESYTSEDHALLSKILTSVKININAVKLIVQPQLDLNALNVFSPEKVLVFGARGHEDIALYEQTTAQGFLVIRADDLDQLDDQKKKNLWVGLRKMFGI